MCSRDEPSVCSILNLSFVYFCHISLCQGSQAVKGKQEQEYFLKKVQINRQTQAITGPLKQVN